MHTVRTVCCLLSVLPLLATGNTAPADPRVGFERTVLTEEPGREEGGGGWSGLAMGDVTGDPDLITGEDKGPRLLVQVWGNDGAGSFTVREIDRGKESHLGTRLSDLDGDLDLVSIACDAFEDVHVWRNDAISGHAGTKGTGSR